MRNKFKIKLCSLKLTSVRFFLNMNCTGLGHCLNSNPSVFFLLNQVLYGKCSRELSIRMTLVYFPSFFS